MQYNQHPQARWTPHHSASFSATPNRNLAPQTRPRHSTLPGPPLPPHPLLPTSNGHPMHMPIPACLTPGRRPPVGVGSQYPSFSYDTSGVMFMSPPHTSFYGDYFFTGTPHSPMTPPPVPQKPLGITAPPPPIPRPPVPPRPSLMAPVSSPRNPLYPQSIPGPIAGPSSQSLQAAEQSPTDDKDIALALAISESEARQREEAISAQEEADLMKALEESRILDSSYNRYAYDTLFDERQDFADGPSSSAQPSSSVASSPGKTFLSPGATSYQISRHPLEGESFLHMITPTTSEHFLDGDDSVPQPGILERQESSQSMNDDSGSNPDHSTPTPPLYTSVISNDTAMSPLPIEFPRASDLMRPSLAHPAPLYPTPSPQLSANAPELPPQQMKPTQSRRPSATHSDSSGDRSLSNDSFSLFSSTAKSSQSTLASTLASPPLSFSSPVMDQLDSVDEDLLEEEEGNKGIDSNSRSGPVLTANQYVEPEMLMGISMGFQRPVISTTCVPMALTMPSLILLPYGKPPIFHFQAPSWRHLLKLMARLSGTRVEPTVEAITVAKQELKLRTVIQFVKIHHSASEWRTLLYFTTDMPVPPSVPNSHKYTNGDVTILPYSYTLSPLPQLLRDGADSPMAKYYVVPATNSTPYPTLPISFPDLAMYLQSAVADSRKAANDSSGGVRKLAHNIDSCYPRDDERPDSMDLSDMYRNRVSGMFKRVIKRGKPLRGRGGNEEIYDLVTPFVSEEWG